MQTLVQKEKGLQEEICPNYSWALKGESFSTCTKTHSWNSCWFEAVGLRKQDILAKAMDVTSHKSVNRDGNVRIVPFIWHDLMMRKFGDKQVMSPKDCLWPVWILVWRRWGILMQECNMFTWNFNKITMAI